MKKTKRNTMVYIDGENIPEKKYDAIKRLVNSIDKTGGMKVYGLRDDPCTRAWSRRSEIDNKLNDIRLGGKPATNKVDKKIKKDIRADAKGCSNCDTVVIVASDHGYASAAKEIRKSGKRVIGIGESNAPRRLRKSFDMFYEI